MMPNFITTTFYAIAPDGSNIDLEIQINVPQKNNKGDYITKINLSGNRPPSLDLDCDVTGGDPIQSLLIAIGFVKNRLQIFEQKGGQLFVNSLRTEESQYSADIWIMPDQVPFGVSDKVKHLLQD